MFLIEYKENNFINAEYIDTVFVGENTGDLCFTLTADNESIFKVNKEFEEIFLNRFVLDGLRYEGEK